MHYQGKAAFLISKPLQLMISLCIVRQGIWDEKPVFIILDAFCGASSVADRLLSAFADLQQPVFFKHRNQAFQYVKQKAFDHFFIDSDIGVKNYLLLLQQKIAKPSLMIHVYEEGVGTYRDDLYQGLKQRMLSALGVGTFFGGSAVVSSIFVYDDEEYMLKFPNNKHKVRKILEPLLLSVRRNYSVLCEVFDYPGLPDVPSKSRVCNFYLSGWHLDKDFISSIVASDSLFFVKPHPHSKDEIYLPSLYVLRGGVPFELIVVCALKLFNVVRVYHVNSSAQRYLDDKAIEFLPLSDFK
ncbi:MAG: hypothetical protein ACK4FZ_13500 [Vogesella sp.]|uniref:hypothetical protein n=1 Tax=Vogesella sp. TaxID=1904252 RepID=UPI00391B641C